MDVHTSRAASCISDTIVLTHCHSLHPQQRIQDMVCTNFTMTSIQSSYNHKSPSIHVAISGISATCQGQYHATPGLSGTVRASVQQSPEASSSTEMSLIFVSTTWNKIKMASSVKTKNCQANLQANQLDFTGSISAKLINLFKGTIASYVSQALSTQVCPAIQPLADKDLTKLIQEANHYMTKWIPDNETTVLDADMTTASVYMEQETRVTQKRQLSAKTNASTVDWKVDTPVLYQVLQGLNEFVDRYLNQGFFVQAMDYIGWHVDISNNCGYFFRGVNGLLHSIGDVSIKIPPRNISIIVPKYAEIKLVLNRVHVSGMDNFTNLELLRPSDNGTFWNSLSTDTDINVTVAMNVEVSSIEGGMFQGDPLKESFQISFNTLNSNVGARLALAYDTHRFGNIHMQDVIVAIENYKNASKWACLLAPLDSLILEEAFADMIVNAIVFTPTGSTGRLEKDMDAMLNNFLQLFLTEYKVLVSESLTGLVGEPIREALNTLVKRWIEQQAKDPICSSIPEPNAEPDYIDFHRWGILRQLNEFLNRSLDAANDYLSCVAGIFNKSSRSVSFHVENTQIELQQLSVQNPGCINHLGEYLSHPFFQNQRVLMSPLPFRYMQSYSLLPTMTFS